MTLSEASTAYSKYVPNGTTGFTDECNDLMRRFFNSGKWNGLVTEIEVANPGALITLAAGYESILAAQLDGNPVSVYGRYHEFLPGGPGEVENAGGMAYLIDNGNRTYKVAGSQDYGVARLTVKRRFVPLAEPVALEATGNFIVSGAGAAAVNGVYQLSDAIYGDRQVYTLAGGLAFTAPTLFYDDGINFWAIGTDDIGWYKSSVDVATPDLVTTWAVDSGGTLPLPTVTAETAGGSEGNTTLPIDNPAALKLGFMSLNYETTGDIGQADEYFGRALSALNGELREARGGAHSVMQASPHGFWLGKVKAGY
jgi:hypothetical protein